MIGYLRGVLLEKTSESVLVDVAGVGYEVTVPVSSLCALPAIGHEAALYIHTHVREDAIRLFGFVSRVDRKVFETLISVSNVGPKLAVGLLGPLGGLELCHVISESNTAALVSIPGVGAKTAERLIVELRGKMQKLIALWDVSPETRATTARRSGEESTQTQVPAALWEEGTTGGKSPTLSALDKRLAQKRTLDDLRSALVNLGYKEKQIAEITAVYETRVKNGEEIVLESALRESLRKLSGHVLQQS